MLVLSTLGVLLALTSAAPQKPSPQVPDDTEIQTTASGLKYSVLVPGSGTTTAKMGDRVTLHYSGWLENGTLFDSSVMRGKPMTQSLQPGSLIAGFLEGIQLMKTGARYKFTIASSLGYGPAGRPPKIPANATLIFEVELLEILAAPRFREANVEKQQVERSGIKWEELEPGTGELVAGDQIAVLEFTCWTTAGKLLQWSGNSRPARCSEASSPVPFMKHAARLMRPGGTYRFEVPPKLGFGPEWTVWELTLIETIEASPAPEFSLSPEDELVTTSSGLQYEVIHLGDGPKPRRTDRVRVHYAGWLKRNGESFDSSYGRGEPAEFALLQVIKGWTEGLQLMPVGSTFKFTIPSELGYGQRGAPGAGIKPGDDLVFQVELLKIL